MGYICIHNHFYQPPRENPWSQAIEQQDSAYPYHDWNERITAERYAPNSASRILDRDNRIVQIVNNYSCISFNFGLLSWLATSAPILPLANSRELHDLSLIERLEAMVDMARSLPFEVVLWTAQNVWPELCHSNFEQLNRSERKGDDGARGWARHFRLLGDKLEMGITCQVRAVTQAGS